MREEVILAVPVPLRATGAAFRQAGLTRLDSTRLIKIIVAYVMFARVEPACLGLCLNADPCGILFVTKQTQPQKCPIVTRRLVSQFFFEQTITPVCFLSLAIEQSGRAACTNWTCCVRSSGRQILLTGMHLGI